MSNEPDVSQPCPSPLAAARAAPRCGACCKRTGLACKAAAMPNGRCRIHGGASTGPRTPEGLARSKAARRRHGNRDAAARAKAALRGQARAENAAFRHLVREVLAEVRERDAAA